MSERLLIDRDKLHLLLNEKVNIFDKSNTTDIPTIGGKVIVIDYEQNEIVIETTNEKGNPIVAHVNLNDIKKIEQVGNTRLDEIRMQAAENALLTPLPVTTSDLDTTWSSSEKGVTGLKRSSGRTSGKSSRQSSRKSSRHSSPITEIEDNRPKSRESKRSRSKSPLNTSWADDIDTQNPMRPENKTSRLANLSGQVQQVTYTLQNLMLGVHAKKLEEMNLTRTKPVLYPDLSGMKNKTETQNIECCVPAGFSQRPGQAKTPEVQVRPGQQLQQLYGQNSMIPEKESDVKGFSPTCTIAAVKYFDILDKAIKLGFKVFEQIDTPKKLNNPNGIKYQNAILFKEPTDVDGEYPPITIVDGSRIFLVSDNAEIAEIQRLTTPRHTRPEIGQIIDELPPDFYNPEIANEEMCEETKYPHNDTKFYFKIKDRMMRANFMHAKIIEIEGQSPKRKVKNVYTNKTSSHFLYTETMCKIDRPYPDGCTESNFRLGRYHAPMYEFTITIEGETNVVTIPINNQNQLEQLEKAKNCEYALVEFVNKNKMENRFQQDQDKRWKEFLDGIQAIWRDLPDTRSADSSDESSDERMKQPEEYAYVQGKCYRLVPEGLITNPQLHDTVIAMGSTYFRIRTDAPERVPIFNDEVSKLSINKNPYITLRNGYRYTRKPLFYIIDENLHDVIKINGKTYFKNKSINVFPKEKARYIQPLGQPDKQVIHPITQTSEESDSTSQGQTEEDTSKRQNVPEPTHPLEIKVTNNGNIDLEYLIQKWKMTNKGENFAVWLEATSVNQLKTRTGQRLQRPLKRKLFPQMSKGQLQFLTVIWEDTFDTHEQTFERWTTTVDINKMIMEYNYYCQQLAIDQNTVPMIVRNERGQVDSWYLAAQYKEMNLQQPYDHWLETTGVNAYLRKHSLQYDTPTSPWCRPEVRDAIQDKWTETFYIHQSPLDEWILSPAAVMVINSTPKPLSSESEESDGSYSTKLQNLTEAVNNSDSASWKSIESNMTYDSYTIKGLEIHSEDVNEQIMAITKLVTPIMEPTFHPQTKDVDWSEKELQDWLIKDREITLANNMPAINETGTTIESIMKGIIPGEFQMNEPLAHIHIPLYSFVPREILQMINATESFPKHPEYLVLWRRLYTARLMAKTTITEEEITAFVCSENIPPWVSIMANMEWDKNCNWDRIDIVQYTSAYRMLTEIIKSGKDTDFDVYNNLIRPLECLIARDMPLATLYLEASKEEKASKLLHATIFEIAGLMRVKDHKLVKAITHTKLTEEMSRARMMRHNDFIRQSPLDQPIQRPLKCYCQERYSSYYFREREEKENKNPIKGNEISRDDQVRILTKEIATSRHFADKMIIEIEKLNNKNDEISIGQRQNLETTKNERLKLVEHNIKSLKELLSQDEEMINKSHFQNMPQQEIKKLIEQMMKQALRLNYLNMADMQKRIVTPTKDKEIEITMDKANMERNQAKAELEKEMALAQLTLLQISKRPEKSVVTAEIHTKSIANKFCKELNYDCEAKHYSQCQCNHKLDMTEPTTIRYPRSFEDSVKPLPRGRGDWVTENRNKKWENERSRSKSRDRFKRDPSKPLIRARSKSRLRSEIDYPRRRNSSESNETSPRETYAEKAAKPKEEHEEVWNGISQQHAPEWAFNYASAYGVDRQTKIETKDEQKHDKLSKDSLTIAFNGLNNFTIQHVTKDVPKDPNEHVFYIFTESVKSKTSQRVSTHSVEIRDEKLGEVINKLNKISTRAYGPMLDDIEDGGNLTNYPFYDGSIHYSIRMYNIRTKRGRERVVKIEASSGREYWSVNIPWLHLPRYISRLREFYNESRAISLK